VVVVAENRKRSDKLCKWLGKRFECAAKTCASTWEDLEGGVRCDVVLVCLDAAVGGDMTPLELMRRVAGRKKRVLVVAIVSDPTQLPTPEQALFTDFLSTPLSEASVMQRVQLVLSLRESEV
jgi:CheY-like chemotaxis protein